MTTLMEKIKFVREATRAAREAKGLLDRYGFGSDSDFAPFTMREGDGGGWAVFAGSIGKFTGESLESCLDAAIAKWSDVATELKDAAVAHAERASKLRDAIYTAAIAPVGAKIIDA